MMGHHRAFRFVLFVALMHVISNNALAHKPSDSYLRIVDSGDELRAEWDISLRDLELLIGLDANQNGEITWGELKSQKEAIQAHAISRLEITAGQQPCEISVAALRVTKHSDGTYAVLDLDIDCPNMGDSLEVGYDLLFDVDPTHRGLVLYEKNGSTSTHILTPDQSRIRMPLDPTSTLSTLGEYVREGVWHIWIGFDHILFLLSLLLPAVWIYRDKNWQSVEEFRPACRAALKIVTVFTAAHSITLWLSVMEYVTMPGWIIESVIAFSIIVTALNNLYPVLRLSSWSIAFFFGLIHGFGFANVLLDLGLSSYALGVSLLGFNLGVEIGQIAIVLAFLPIAYFLRESWFYRWIVFRAGSVLIAIISAIWMYERMANVEILGF